MAEPTIGRINFLAALSDFEQYKKHQAEGKNNLGPERHAAKRLAQRAETLSRFTVELEVTSTPRSVKAPAIERRFASGRYSRHYYDSAVSKKTIIRVGGPKVAENEDFAINLHESTRVDGYDTGRWAQIDLLQPYVQARIGSQELEVARQIRDKDLHRIMVRPGQTAEAVTLGAANERTVRQRVRLVAEDGGNIQMAIEEVDLDDNARAIARGVIYQAGRDEIWGEVLLNGFEYGEITNELDGLDQHEMLYA